MIGIGLRRAGFSGLVLAIFVLGVTASASYAWEYAQGPPRVESVPWSGLIGPDPEGAVRTLTFSVSSGYCVGEPKPRIDRIKIVERPKTAKRPFKSSIITAFVRFPVPTEVVGSVNPGEPQPACAGLGIGFLRRVKLKRPVGDLILFDGSFSPPRRVWPSVR